MPEQATKGTVLAFDFGLQRIGVALGEGLLGQARALTTLKVVGRAARLAAIARLIEEWQPQLLVVGLPCHTDGQAHETTRQCHNFARQLEQHFGLPVSLVDERYSSVEAEARLAQSVHDWRARKEQLDAVAAQIILQDFFDRQAGSPGS